MTSPGHDRISRSFRRGFETYAKAADVQALVADQLAALLQTHRGGAPVARAFEFGCGTGNLTRALTDRFAISDLTLNDLVPEAEAAARRACEHVASVRFVSGPVETLIPVESYDLIASASTVQWVSDQPVLLNRLAAQLAPGGWLALSGFGRAQFCELTALGSTAAAPGYLDAGDWPQIVPEGLELVALVQEQIVLSFPTAREVLRHLRRTGVNGRARSGWTRDQLHRFEADYATRFGNESGVRLTYDPVLTVLRKPA